MAKQEKVEDSKPDTHSKPTEEAKPAAEAASDEGASVKGEEEATVAAPEHAVGEDTAQASDVKLEEDPPVFSGENSAGGDVTVPPT